MNNDKQTTFLFVSANPPDSHRLSLDVELREIVNALMSTSSEAGLRIIPCVAARATDLQRSFNTTKPAVVHITGHGTESGGTVLVGDNGTTEVLAADALVTLFRHHRKCVRLAFLATMHSLATAEKVAAYVDCAIGLESCTDAQAVDFVGRFYNCLGAGASVGNAFEQASSFSDARWSQRRLKPSNSFRLHVRDGIDAYQVFPLVRDDTVVGNPGSKTVQSLQEQALRSERRRPAPPLAAAAPAHSIFLSYSHADENWLERIKVVLKPLEHLAQLSVWSDKDIAAGSDWRRAVAHALDQATVAMLLVSPDYLASDRILTNELPELLDRAQTKGVLIFWIPLRPSTYELTPIERYQSASDSKCPLSTLPPERQEAVLVDIVRQIHNALGRA